MRSCVSIIKNFGVLYVGELKLVSYLECATSTANRVVRIVEDHGTLHYVQVQDS